MTEDTTNKQTKIVDLFFTERYDKICHKANFSVFSHINQSVGNKMQILTHALMSYALNLKDCPQDLKSP